MRQLIRQKGALLLVLGALVVVAVVWSVMLFNAGQPQTLDQRVRDVGRQLQCPICQNESVADSPSGLAQQMRENIRQQLQAGKSEQEVITYFVERYGEQILWNPQGQGFTLLIWLAPVALVIGGSVLLFFILRDWRRSARGEERKVEKELTDKELTDIEDAEFKFFEKQLEQELAADDPLFTRNRTEAR